MLFEHRVDIATKIATENDAGELLVGFDDKNMYFKAGCLEHLIAILSTFRRNGYGDRVASIEREGRDTWLVTIVW